MQGLFQWVNHHPVTVLIAVVVASIVVAWLFWERPRLPVYGKKPLLTENEKEFLSRLEEAFPEFSIYCQVAMGALLQPINVVTASQRMSVRGTFAQKICDYVMVDPETREVLAIIELDDRTHSAQKDAQRDAMLNQAGYLTFRFESRHKPAPEDIRNEVLQEIAFARRETTSLTS